MKNIVSNIASHKLVYVKLLGAGCQLILVANALANAAKEAKEVQA